MPGKMVFIMKTQTTPAAISKDHKETAPEVYTSYQVELMITAAVNKITLAIIEQIDRETLLSILDTMAEIKNTRPEMFIPRIGDADYWQWKEATREKAYHYPQLLTQDEKKITPPTAPKPGKWDEMTTADLVKAVELMIAPEDLAIREAATALLDVFSFNREDVREVMDKGEYFNAGWVFYGLNTIRPQIINTLADTPQA